MRGLHGVGIRGMLDPLFGAGYMSGGLFSTIMSLNPILYFPLNELSGTAAINYGSLGVAANGVYSGVTLGQLGVGDGNTSVYLNGSTSYVNYYSTSLRDAMNYREGTFIVWIKVPDWATWDDAVVKYIMGIYPAATDNMFVRKNTDMLTFVRAAGGIEPSIPVNIAYLQWTCFSLSYSETNNRNRVYINGTKHPIDQSLSGGVWNAAKVLTSTTTCLGALNTTPTGPFNGNMAHFAILDREITESEALQASIIPPRPLTTEPGSLCIVFDDGWSGAYDGFQYASSKGVKATVYMISDFIGSASYLTAYQLQEMDAAGWIIGNHTSGHANLSVLSEADQEIQLATCEAALNALGLTAGSKHVAYPYGASNADTITAMTNLGMLTGRKVDPAAYTDPVTVDPYLIYTTSATILTGTTVASLVNIARKATTRGWYCLLLFHNLSDIPSGGEYPNASFRSLIDWIVSEGIPTKTIVDLYNDIP